MSWLSAAIRDGRESVARKASTDQHADRSALDWLAEHRDDLEWLGGLAAARVLGHLANGNKGRAETVFMAQASARDVHELRAAAGAAADASVEERARKTREAWARVLSIGADVAKFALPFVVAAL